MFFLFKKNKPVVVDAFTYDAAHAEGYPIVKATQYTPEWWKELPQSLPDFNDGHQLVTHGTMKRCHGFMDLYTRSFILPLWSDVSIELQIQMEQKIWRYKFADMSSEFDIHHESQFKNFIDYRQCQQFKFKPKWRLKETSGVKFLVTQPTWNMGNSIFKFHVLPGVVDFRNQHGIDINTMWQCPNTEGVVESTLLEADTPLAQIIPLTDRSVNIKTHLVSFDEYNKIFGVLGKFKGKYKEREKINDRNDAQKKSCPFHRFH